MRKRGLEPKAKAAAVLVLGLLLAGGLGGAMWAQRDKPAAAKPEVTLEFSPREVVHPQAMAMPLVLQFSGPLVAPQTAVVRAKASGTLLALAVDEGSRVRAGQVLGRIDLAELDSRVNERHAMLASARAQLAQAERNYQSNLRLADQQFISANALDTSRAQLDTAHAQWQAAQAQVDSLRVTQRDAALVAPIAGVVARRHVVPGEKLAAEQQVLTLVDLARLELAGSVGTHEVSLLAPGLPVQVQVEGVATPVAATLARIAPAAEPGSRAIGVTVALDNPKETYRAGQYALARVVLPDAQQRLTLPASAIGSQSGQEHVWLIEGGVLARRAVITGRRDEAGSRVEVLQGVAADAQVLAARFDNLREGTRALLLPGRTASVAASGASAAPLK